MGTIRESLDSALSKARPADTYAAAVRLAIEYADQLDAGGDLAKLGPQLLAVLTALRMTPAGRAAVVGKGGAASEPTRSPLDELRARRAARQRDAATVDTAAP